MGIKIKNKLALRNLGQMTVKEETAGNQETNIEDMEKIIKTQLAIQDESIIK